jgi:hypothetical protein
MKLVVAAVLGQPGQWIPGACRELHGANTTFAFLALH